MSEKAPLKIVVIANDSDNAKTAAAAVNKSGHALKGKYAPSQEALVQALSSQLWDAVLISQPIPSEMSIEEISTTVAHHNPGTAVIVMGNAADEASRLVSMRAGANDLVSIDQTELLGLILKRELNVRLQGAEQATDVAHENAPKVSVAPSPDTLHAEDKVWFERIKAALANDRFSMAYQPIVNLNAEPTPSYELLLRMLDDSGDEIAPGAFISSAEKAGLMGEIDRWVIRNAVVNLAERQKKDVQTRFFVKLSAATVTDDGFVPWLAEVLRTGNLAEESLVFEITEADALAHEHKVQALIPALNQIKCRSALDHVGASNNTHEFWVALMPDYIKLSGRLVRNLAENKDDQATIMRLAGYAKSHKIQTIAQFVQDPASLAFLWQRGINYIQGYYLQRPDAELNYDFTQEM